MTRLHRLSLRPSRRAFLQQTAAAGAFVVAAPRLVRAATKVSFQLDWIAYGRDAPYYVAVDKGFYAKHGLDVNVEQGRGTEQGFRYLATGRAQFGFLDIGSMITLRSREQIKVKALACVYQRAPHTVFFIEGRGISKPKDLEGKTIAYSAGDSPKLLFPAFAAANGIDESKIHWLAVDPNSKNAVLLNHTADAMVTYIFTLPVLQKSAQNGEKIGTFIYSDYGADFYGNGILAMDDYVSKSAGICRGFVPATMEGIQYTLAHPEEAISILKKHQPQLNTEVALKEIPILRRLAVTRDTKENGLGHMNRKKMQETENLTVKYLNLKNHVPADELFTDEFIEKKI